MVSKVLLVGNSDEFLFSMKIFPEMLLRMLRDRNVPVRLIRPKTVFGKLAPWTGPLGKWLFYIDKFLLFPVYLKWVVWRERDPGLVVHICDHSNAMYVRHVANVPHLVTCHDMMPIKSALGEIPQNPTSRTGKIFQQLILNGLKRAGFVACVSTASQRDLLRIVQCPEAQTSVVFNSLNYAYTTMPMTEARARVKSLLGAEFRYLLHVGGDAWYKNRVGVLTIYSDLRRRLRARGETVLPKLVYAGPSLNRELEPFLESDPGMADDLFGVQGVEREMLRALYSAAELLLFPSWDEGFGWPIIEAQACGCRAVTTNKAPMTEVGGDGAFYVDPHDPVAATDLVLAVWDQPAAEREAAIGKGIANARRFTEDQMIEKYIGLYHQLTSTPTPAQL